MPTHVKSFALVFAVAFFAAPVAAAPLERWAVLGDGPGSAMLVEYFR